MLLQFWRDRRPGQLQGLDDISSVTSLILGDEGVGVALSTVNEQDGGEDQRVKISFCVSN